MIAPAYAKGEKIVLIVSGGMDSATLVHLALKEEMHPIIVSCDYGQKHRKELQYAEKLARKLVLQHKVVDLTGLTPHISNSALTSDAPVPEGHYAAENMKQTVVPNRNMIMLSIAAGIAVNEGAIAVGTGVHAGDHYIYPDCRPDFIKAAAVTVKVGNEGFVHEKFFVYAPFLNLGKHDIARLGNELGVDYTKTWSCYNGRDLHCGVCGTCVERKEAFGLAELDDPTIYEDTPVNV